MTDAILAPEFQDNFSVIRRTYSIDGNGRAVLAPQVPVPATGIVTPTSPKDLERLPDDQRQRKTITIVTNYTLQGVIENGVPDRVQWNNDLYQVADLEDYSRYGPGFIRAICGIVTSQPSVA